MLVDLSSVSFGGQLVHQRLKETFIASICGRTNYKIVEDTLIAYLNNQSLARLG